MTSDGCNEGISETCHKEIQTIEKRFIVGSIAINTTIKMQEYEKVKMKMILMKVLLLDLMIVKLLVQEMEKRQNN